MIAGVILFSLGLLGICWGIGDNSFYKLVIFTLIFCVGSVICALSCDTIVDNVEIIEAEPVGYSSAQTFFEDNQGNILRVDGNFPGGEYLLTVENDEVLAVWQNIVIGDVG